MRLILVRHGETEENRRDILQGQIPGKLSKKGKSQAKKLSKRLSKEHFDIIYCSDLKRTKDTCKEIKKYHPTTPVKYVKELRERSFGALEGKKHTEIEEYLKCHNVTFSEFKPKGGETGLQKNRRVIKFLDKTLKRHPDKTILWVTHGGVKFSVLNNIFKLEGDHKKALTSEHTAVSVIEFDGDGNHKIHLVNCVKHLL